MLRFHSVSVLILIPHCGLCFCHLKWNQHALQSTTHFHVMQIPKSRIIIFGYGLPFPLSQSVSDWNCKNFKSQQTDSSRCLPKFLQPPHHNFQPLLRAISNISRVARYVQGSVLHSCALLAQLDVWFCCTYELPRHFPSCSVNPLDLLLCLISLVAFFLGDYSWNETVILSKGNVEILVIKQGRNCKGILKIIPVSMTSESICDSQWKCFCMYELKLSFWSIVIIYCCCIYWLWSTQIHYSV
jgi:hypothetical protein